MFNLNLFNWMLILEEDLVLKHTEPAFVFWKVARELCNSTSKNISKIQRVFQTFKKLEKLELAGLALGLTGEPIEFPESSLDFSDDILLSFSQYENEKARIKASVVNCKTAGELIFWTGYLLKIQKAYIRLWPEMAELNLDEVIIGKEPDPMELLNDMKELKRMGTWKFDQLSISSCETLVTFYNEWKRLSLLRQKELEWTKASSIN